MFKGVAIVGNLLTFDLGSCPPCECSLVWRETPPWAELELQLSAGDCQHPCPETVQQGGTSGSRNQSVLSRDLCRVPECLRGSWSRLQRQGHRHRGSEGTDRAVTPATGVCVPQTWERHNTRGCFPMFCWACHVMCSEEILLCLRVFCCLWLSLTSTFPCWGKQINILRVTPHCKR